LHERVAHVVVVGGGIAGLAAAHAFAQAGMGVTVLESAPSVGGKLRVASCAGLPVDEGAEQVLVRVPEAVDLIRTLGLGDDLIHPRSSAASVWTRGAMRPLPTGTVLGVPADPVALVRSGAVSPAGLLRAAADLWLPRTPVGDDIAVGRYVAARAGREVVDRLVDPLLGGVYAGRADGLSMFATVPQLAMQLPAHRTLLGAARAARPTDGAQGAPVFASLRGGLGRLAAALAAAVTSLGVEIRTGVTARAIEPLGPDGYRITVGSAHAPDRVDADAVVVAVPAHPAARLLRDVAPAAATEIGAIDYASVATVVLGYPAAAVPPLRGSGFLVPAVERRMTKAVTFLSAKWEHLASPDVFLLRGSVGRYGDEHELQRDDAELVDGVHDDLVAALGITAKPVVGRVTRWGGGLPQYAPGHLDRVRRARAALPAAITVCGAAYDGVGVPACIRSGQTAAELLRQWARGRSGEQGEGA
jgi:oxygen-dependent protoporphyrinogen oxidase